MDEPESKTERGTSPQTTSKTIADLWQSVKQALRRFCSSETPVETDVSMFEEDPSSAFELKRLFPLAVVCLGFGWLLKYLFGALNVFIDSGNKYAILPLGAFALFGAIIAFLHFVRPKKTNWIICIGIAIFTAVVGIKILWTIQSMAIYSAYSGKRPPMGIIGLFIKLIGYAYIQIDNENVSWLGKLFGFVFGVGLCEESVKLLPIFLLVVFRNRLPFKLDLSFRSILVFGFFSGLGFGIAEALTDFYCLLPVERGADSFIHLWIQEISGEGISQVDKDIAREIYEQFMQDIGVGNRMAASQIVRWFACVPSHAIYTVIDVAFLWMLYHHIKDEKDARFQFLWYIGCVGACAVVHGVYNTVCGIPGLGFVFDAISLVLVWFVIRRAINVEDGGIDESDSSLENFREKSVSTFGKTFAKMYLCLFIGTIAFFGIRGGDNPREKVEKRREYWTRRIDEHQANSVGYMEEGDASGSSASDRMSEPTILAKPSNMYEDLLAGRISLPSFYKHAFDKEYCEFYRTDGGVLDPNADLWNQRMRAAREEYAKEHPEAGIRLSSGKRNLYEDVMEGRVTLPTFYRHAFDAETGEFYRTDGRTLDPQAALWNKRMQLAREEYESQNKQ